MQNQSGREQVRLIGYIGMKRIVIDLDGTLTIDTAGSEYQDKLADLEVVETLRAYKREGFEIIIYTARNMRRFSSNVGKINSVTLPVIIAWLEKHNVPYDEIHVGKPWCGLQGFYVDDKAIRPDEFKTLNYEQISDLLGLSG